MWVFIGLFTQVQNFMGADRGATAIEYAIIAALVSIAVLTGITNLGSGVSNMFNTINTAIN